MDPKDICIARSMFFDFSAENDELIEHGKKLTRTHVAAEHMNRTGKFIARPILFDNSSGILQKMNPERASMDEIPKSMIVVEGHMRHSALHYLRTRQEIPSQEIWMMTIKGFC